jgi:hypothetical protein
MRNADEVLKKPLSARDLANSLARVLQQQQQPSTEDLRVCRTNMKASS